MSFSARQLTSYSCMRPAAEAGCGGAGFSEPVTLASVIGSSVNRRLFPCLPSRSGARAVGATESHDYIRGESGGDVGGISHHVDDAPQVYGLQSLNQQ